VQYQTATIDESIHNLVDKSYSWGSGYIKFCKDRLETTWGNGIYTIKDVNTVYASWSGYDHILRFNDTYTKAISIRTIPDDCMLGSHRVLDPIKLFENRIDMINTLVPKGGSYAEIGIFKGELSKILYTMLEPSKLVLFDIFNGIEYSADQDGNNMITWDLTTTYNDLLDYSKSNPGIVLMKGDSSSNLNIFSDHTFDMIYIDGDHSYEGCKSDIEVAYKKIKKGGWIMGHDYEMNMNKAKTVYSFGVRKAVDEFCNTYKQTIYAKALDGCVSYAIQIL
jgi:hypothetical protein